MNIDFIRSQFPILRQRINGYPIVYLDSAATSQKPQCVIDAVSRYYEEYNSNIHRSIHTLADRATEAYEQARSRIAEFINAEADEIIFVRNSNEGINVVANGVCQLLNSKFEIRNSKQIQNRKFKTKSLDSRTCGDDKGGSSEKITILTTVCEHHANFVPWLRLQNEGKVEIKLIPVSRDEEMDLEWVKKYFQNNAEIQRKKHFLAINYVSNVTGVVNPIKEIKKIVSNKALILVDAAQAASHFPIDVKKLGVDFLVFSGHKVFGPTGTSVLWGRKELLQKLPPLLVGSSMIGEVTDKNYTLAQVPTRFEAGTPDIAGAIGLGVAVKWFSQIQNSKFRIQNGEYYNIEKKEKKLLEIMIQGLEKINGIHIIGPKNVEKRSGLVSFCVERIHPHDVAALLDKKGIAVRAGHHCAEPLHKFLGIEASVRASVSLFNTEEEMNYFLDSLQEVIQFLKRSDFRR